MISFTAKDRVLANVVTVFVRARVRVRPAAWVRPAAG